jgi:hypothetical protein
VPQWLSALDELRGVDPIVAGIRDHLAALPAGEPVTVLRSFPLDSARTFPWHPESARNDRHDYCGTPAVLRLRREMITATMADCGHALAQVQNEAAAELGAVLKVLGEDLVAAVGESALWIRELSEVRAEVTTNKEATS